MSDTDRGLASALARHEEAEREQALRALLMRPLMTSADPDFPAVRRHADTLRQWFTRECGWVLRVDRDLARLYKRAADTSDATRGVPDFDRRRYVLLCLVCAVLERADPQITLKTLGDRLLELAADPALETRGFTFTLKRLHERRELVHVCEYLLGLGVLVRVAGDEESFVQQAGDALYDIQRRVLAALLACTRGPSTYGTENAPRNLEERLAAVSQEYVPDTAEGRRTATRHALARRLLDDPVVYLDELNEDEGDYFRNQRGTMAARLCAAAGLTAEHRAEGSALIDAQGELTDAALPAEGTLAHATLLVAGQLAEIARNHGDRPIGQTEVAVFLRRAAEEYGRYWRKDARAPGAENTLTSQALARLAALKLIKLGDDGIRVRSALFRFALGAPDIKASSPTGDSLTSKNQTPA